MYNILDPFFPNFMEMKITGDTLMPNGQSYKLFTDGFTEFYWRVEGSKVIEYLAPAWGQSEFVRYDFSASVGDTICRNPLLVVKTYDGMDSVFYEHQKRRVMEFVSSNGWVADDVVDSIGVYNFNVRPTDITYVLLGARIDDRIYGTILGVPNRTNNTPDEVRLYQNYPNPFNPSTTIQFELPAPGDVSLVIYNMLGQRVATLIRQQMRSGQYSVKWNASRIPNGTYVYALRVGNNITTKTMILLR